ncbi:MAG: hypothetical protein VXY41_05520, partial [Pseudomonadota bacterium]|nr:hypothetical protein [Pseudomonadota bacterium]
LYKNERALCVNLPVDSLNSSARGAKNRSAPDNREKNILAAPGISPLNLFHAAPTFTDALDDLRRSQALLYRPKFFGIDVDHGSCKPVRRDALGDFYDKAYAYRCHPPGRNPCGGFERQSDRRI